MSSADSSGASLDVTPVRGTSSVSTEHGSHYHVELDRTPDMFPFANGNNNNAALLTSMVPRRLHVSPDTTPTSTALDTSWTEVNAALARHGMPHLKPIPLKVGIESFHADLKDDQHDI